MDESLAYDDFDLSPDLNHKGEGDHDDSGQCKKLSANVDVKVHPATDNIILAIEHMVSIPPPIPIPITTTTQTAQNSLMTKEMEIPPTVCAHPTHLHSLTRLTNISTILRSRFSMCSVCSERISIVAGMGDIVTCIACSIFMHRKCSQKKGIEVCAVNKKLVEDRRRFLDRHMKQCSVIPSSSSERDNHQDNASTLSNPKSNVEVYGNGGHLSTQGNLLDQALSFSNCSSSTDNNSLSSNDGIWSNEGPPAHWALSSKATTALKGIKSHSEYRSAEDEAIAKRVDETRKEEQDWKTSFANLSRILQKNVTFNRECEGYEDEDKDTTETATVSSSHISEDDNSNTTSHHEHVLHSSSISKMGSNDKEVMENSKAVMQSVSRTMQSGSGEDESSSTEIANNYNYKYNSEDEEGEDIPGILKEAAPLPPSPSKTQSAIRGTVNAVNVVRKTNQTRKNMGVMSIAGGIAGATAGLIVGGPAAAFVGSKIGQGVALTVGVGVAVIDTVGVGVLVGVTGTVLTFKNIKGNENRMVTIGGEGSEKVVLVRPNVIVDPVWEQITMKARRSAPRDNIINGFALFGDKKMSRDERNRRAEEIVYSKEGELNTWDKVFLLVANSLNDKTSLQGYVYRELIREAKKRDDARKNNSGDEAEASEEPDINRAMRQDVHGIIKHVTATLLDVRPGFSSSTRMTEMSALAVETIVFGELYSLVIDEIHKDPAVFENDRALDEKIRSVQTESNDAEADVDLYRHISEEALSSIRMMPQYNSVQEKLRCCVKLLEQVSKVGASANMGADFLLTLVCQHLVIAHVSNLNAECSFLEEFATDDQLLRGKEGYALVTIQASLHFLNASQNLVKDVFQDDDDCID